MPAGKRAPYTSDVSRIVLSFNNANGGHVFVHWLRNELMRELDYFSSRSVYLDNVETRNFGNSQATVRHLGLGAAGAYGAAAGAGVAANAPIVGPDTRGVKKGGHTPIGAMFVDAEGTPQSQQTWFKSWQAALAHAKALIQLQTPEYFESGPCAQEMGRIDEQLQKQGNKLTVIALTLSDKLPQMASARKARTMPLRLGPTIPYSPP